MQVGAPLEHAEETAVVGCVEMAQVDSFQCRAVLEHVVHLQGVVGVEKLQVNAF